MIVHIYMKRMTTIFYICKSVWKEAYHTIREPEGFSQASFDIWQILDVFNGYILILIFQNRQDFLSCLLLYSGKPRQAIEHPKQSRRCLQNKVKSSMSAKQSQVVDVTSFLWDVYWDRLGTYSMELYDILARTDNFIKDHKAIHSF